MHAISLGLRGFEENSPFTHMIAALLLNRELSYLPNVRWYFRFLH